LNDEFFPVFECAPYDYQLDIFNRWGVKIATINDPSIGWNGKQGGEPMEDGVYAYRLQYSEVFAGFLIIKTGHIVLMQMGKE
jgi:gliding motility-associated-like protein